MAENPIQYCVFLRGINVGGNKKVPMADLKAFLTKLDYKNVHTVLNSGNILLEAPATDPLQFGQSLEKSLDSQYGFTVPVTVRTVRDLKKLMAKTPFSGIESEKNLRFYITFLRQPPISPVEAPWQTTDGAWRILYSDNAHVASVVNLDIGQTVDAMASLDKMYGKDITTRNWNTLIRLEKLWEAA